MPRIIWIAGIRPHCVNRLEAIEHKHFLFTRVDRYLGLTSFESFDEEACHLKKSSVVKVSIVVCSCRFFKHGGRCGVRRAYVAGFTKVYLGQYLKVNYELSNKDLTVPRDNLNVVGLEIQQIDPSIDPYTRVLSMKPVHVAGRAPKEPRRNACHPRVAVGITLGSKGCISIVLLGHARGWMHPSERTEALIC